MIWARVAHGNFEKQFLEYLRMTLNLSYLRSPKRVALSRSRKVSGSAPHLPWRAWEGERTFRFWAAPVNMGGA